MKMCLLMISCMQDTLIIEVDATRVEQYMTCIRRAGTTYGLTFNWSKLEVLPVRCQALINKPDGSQVVQKDRMVYLGATLSNDGQISSELSRRLGAAQAEFGTLSKVWAHSTLALKKKLQIFQACVLSKLLYCLHTAWLSSAELRKLDAFQARCLRKTLGVPHSYISRVTNTEVLQKASQHKLSSILLERQMNLMRKLALKTDDDLMRGSLFCPSTFELKRHTGRRGRGRPRATCATEVFKHCCCCW